MTLDLFVFPSGFSPAHDRALIQAPGAILLVLTEGLGPSTGTL